MTSDCIPHQVSLKPDADDGKPKRKPKREQEDEEPFERSVKEGSGGGATKPPGDNGTEGCSSWPALR